MAGRLPLKLGRADAVIVTPPITLMAIKRFPLLIDASRLNIPYTSAVVVTRKSFIQVNRPAAVNSLRARSKGFLLQNPQGAKLQVMSKYMRIQDREVLEENFRADYDSLRPYATDAELGIPIKRSVIASPRPLRRIRLNSSITRSSKNWKRPVSSIAW